MDNINIKPRNDHEVQMKRSVGSTGIWSQMPKHEEFISALNANLKLLRIDDVDVNLLNYPKHTGLINKTAVFSYDGKKYRFSDDFNGKRDLIDLHPAVRTWAGHVQARIGGIDLFHTYTLWIVKDYMDTYRNQDVSIIVHAENTPKPLTAAMLQSMMGLHPLLAKMVVTPVMCESYVNEFNKNGRGRKAVNAMANSENNRLLGMIVSCVPYFRMIRAPLLFRLWPQKQIMQLKYKDFCKVANAVEQATLRGDCFGFPWLMPCPNLDELDLAHLHTFQHALNYANDPMARDEQVIVEFFQTALEANRRDGNTFATIEQLAKYYVDKPRYGSATPLFNFNTIFGLNPDKKMESTHILETVKRMIPHAIKSSIIKIQHHPEFDCTKAIYAMDDYMKQEYVARFINEGICEKRWHASVLTDGCNTPTDVANRIRLARPPVNIYFPGTPKWHNQRFQEIYATLDDEQREAVAVVVLSPFAVISGPPGAGKTKTIEALFHLFDGDTFSVPMAPYGRIASMLRDLLDGKGFTFHRASGIAKFQEKSKEAVNLKKSCIWFMDEYGLQTHHHLYMVFKNFGHMVSRLVFTGDPEQKGAIGSGNFGKTLYKRVCDNPAISVHLALPHRFVSNQDVLPRSIRQFVWIKPHVSDSMTIAWNMRQIVHYKRSSPGNVDRYGQPITPNALDLVYSTNLEDEQAKFILTPRRFNVAKGMAGDREGLKATLIPILSAILGEDCIHSGTNMFKELHARGVQFITQRNNDRVAINEAIFQIAFGVQAEQMSMRTYYKHERITFVKNKYFVRKGDETVAMEGADDRELEYVNVLEQAAQANGGDNDPLNAPTGTLMQMAAVDQELSTTGFFEDNPVIGMLAPPANTRGMKRKREEGGSDQESAEDIYAKGRSDDVFNGEIRQITHIADLNNNGEVIQEFNDSDARSDRRSKKERPTRMLVFNDLKGMRRTLNTTDDYDTDEMDRAYCLTSSKMQGSDDKIVIYLITPSIYGNSGVVNTLFNEEMYMAITRAKLRVIIVAGNDESTGHLELMAIARNREKMPRNALANLLNIIKPPPSVEQ